MSDRIHHTRCRIAVCCRLRDIQRVRSVPYETVTYFIKIRNINIRAVHINGRCTVIPHLMDSCNRSAARVISRRICRFIQPAVYCHRKIVGILSSFCHIFYKRCYMVSAEYLLCHSPEYFAPGTFLCPCFHSGADIFLHVFGVASHIRGKLLRHFACKSCVCLIGNFPCISEKSCLIFHLNRDDGSVCLIVLAHMLHHFPEGSCIRLHGIL